MSNKDWLSKIEKSVTGYAKNRKKSVYRLDCNGCGYVENTVENVNNSW